MAAASSSQSEYSLPYQTALASVGLDTSLLGPMLSYGNEHVIFAYGHDWVVKIPRYRTIHSILPFDQLEQNLTILQERIPQYVPETEIYAGLEGQYVIKQERLHQFRPLSCVMSLPLQTQFHALLEVNAQMIADSHQSLDFFGSEGLASSSRALWHKKTREDIRMTNIAVAEDRTHHHRLLILDTSLLHLQFPWGKPHMVYRWMSDSISFQSNIAFIKRWYPLSHAVSRRYQLI